jgi:hypothetical protein
VIFLADRLRLPLAVVAPDYINHRQRDAKQRDAADAEYDIECPVYGLSCGDQRLRVHINSWQPVRLSINWLQIRLFGPYFSFFSTNSYGY